MKKEFIKFKHDEKVSSLPVKVFKNIKEANRYRFKEKALDKAKKGGKKYQSYFGNIYQKEN